MHPIGGAQHLMSDLPQREHRQQLRRSNIWTVASWKQNIRHVFSSTRFIMLEMLLAWNCSE
eukprot:m.735817 g.735817  ORF g.735817 m.735817 type:complete len:61 (+) comp58893_c0_seq28:285-467(+)